MTEGRADNRDRPFLPYGRQLIDEGDIRAVADVLRSDWLTTGPAVERFEDALRQATGAAHAVACSSGTAALHLAAMALDLGPEDCIVVPDMTFAATAAAPAFTGARVVLADVDAQTGLMGSDHFQAALARAPGPVRAVFPVHLNGQCADLAAIDAIARPRGIRIVADACHALGSRYMQEGRECRAGGGDADMTVFSFHPVKTIAAGEGGAIVTGNEALAARLRRLRNHGITRDPEDFTAAGAVDPAGKVNPWHYEIHETGLNYRLSDIHAALAYSQMGRLEDFIAKRRSLHDEYCSALAPLAPTVGTIRALPGQNPAWHLAVALIDFAAAGIGRGDVMRALRERGIGTQVHYIPLHRQPAFADAGRGVNFPGAEAYFAKALSLPLHAGMQRGDVHHVVEALTEILKALS